MHFKTRNVNTAFRELVNLFADHSETGTYTKNWTHKKCEVIRRNFRNGPVLMIDEPVMITYSHPKERVLFNQARDANPFFHMYEALWMLAGRNDVKSLAYYAKDMLNFSDDGETLNGAYGYRWRHSTKWEFDEGETYGAKYIGKGFEFKNVDQFRILIDHLKADPTSRRAVLQMWNVEDDLLKIGQECDECRGVGGICDDGRKGMAGVVTKTCDTCKGRKLQSQFKDVCCNLSVMFSIRDTQIDNYGTPILSFAPMPKYLDMTVTNRSNDMIWGMLGANYVHFTFLQEYMAAQLGVEVGTYTQFTNNLHVYESNWKPEEWLAAYDREMYNPYVAPDVRFLKESPDNLLKADYLKVCDQQEAMRKHTHHPLIKDPVQFEKELFLFVETFSGENPNRRTQATYTEPFLKDVAAPMMIAFYQYKQRDSPAHQGCMKVTLEECQLIQADDWRIAANQWLLRNQ